MSGCPAGPRQPAVAQVLLMTATVASPWQSCLRPISSQSLVRRHAFEGQGLIRFKKFTCFIKDI